MADKSISPIKWEHIKEFFVRTGNRADGKIEKLDLGVASSYPYEPGRIHFDPVTGSHVADTPFNGVRINIGRESVVPVYNDTGGTIVNGTPVAGSGLYVGGLPSIIPADADIIQHIAGFLGVVTADILDGAVGLSTKFGAVRDVDTSAFVVAPVFLASGGGLTQVLPRHPTNRLLIGGITAVDIATGIIGVDPVHLPRLDASRSYSFVSLGTGTDWKAGFYDWEAADANLSQASLTELLGVAGKTYAAHVGIVPSGPGVVDTGQVGLRVTGTQDHEDGPQVAAQTGIVTEDITTLTANVMAETSEKFSGEVTLELYVVSGAPTAYSLDFNYGYSKYEDMANQDSTVTSFSAVWLGGATDNAFDIALRHHKPVGWTYAATGFTPGNGDIIRRTVDQGIESGVINGVAGAWKRIDLGQFIDGNGAEGVLIEIITTANNSIQTMDMHIAAVSEEL